MMNENISCKFYPITYQSAYDINRIMSNLVSLEASYKFQEMVWVPMKRIERMQIPIYRHHVRDFMEFRTKRKKYDE